MEQEALGGAHVLVLVLTTTGLVPGPGHVLGLFGLVLIQALSGLEELLAQFGWVQNGLHPDRDLGQAPCSQGVQRLAHPV